jgi:hypothetical protein
MSEERPENPLLADAAGARRTWRCPDEDLLAAYIEQRLDELEKQRVESHLADCDFCLGQVTFLMGTQEAGEPAAVPPRLLRQASDLLTAQGSAAPRAVWRWGAVAAATASLLVIVVISLHRPGTKLVPLSPPPAEQPQAPALPIPETVSRPANASTIRREQKKAQELKFVSPREGSVLTPGEVLFRWKPVRDCEFYEVRLVSAEGDLLWEERVTGTQTRLPANLELVSGQQYFVWVRAYLPEGKTLKSPAVGFKAQERR